MKLNPWVQLIVILGLSMLACSSSSNELLGIPFPKRDIIFEKNNLRNYAIGFVNADGSDPVIIPTKSQRIIKPLWSRDKTYIYFSTIIGNQEMENSGAGDIGVWANEMGISKWCSGVYTAWVVYPTNSTYEVYYSNGPQLVLLNLKNCSKENLLVDYPPTPGPLVHFFSLSNDGRYILYTEINNGASVTGILHTIIKIDLQTKRKWVLNQGICATFSPGNRQIAFVQPDGIYMMDSNGGNVRRLVAYQTDDFPEYEDLPPIPNWSPDGQWLVYHKCKDGIYCEQANDFSIYKLNIASGKEIKIFDGGIYPYWP